MSPRLLLVEDEIDAREALARALARAGYSVTAVGSAAAALEAARSGLPVDLAVVDVRLGTDERGGVELLRPLVVPAVPGLAADAIAPSAPAVPASTPGNLPMTSPMVSAPIFSMSARLMMTFWVADSRRSATSLSLVEDTVTSLSVFSSAAHATARNRPRGKSANRFM